MTRKKGTMFLAVLLWGCMIMMAWAAGNYPQPTICDRACWSARSPQCTIDQEPDLNRAVIHHTASTSDWDTDGVDYSASRVRAHQNYHMDSLGWCDIGYHFLIDKLGNNFEGREGSMTGTPRGAHDGVNDCSFGFSNMAYCHDPYYHDPTCEMRQACYDLIAWRIPDPFDGYGSGSYGSGDAGFVCGHRDVGSTACPGDLWYAYIGTDMYAGEARDNINTRITTGDGSGPCGPTPTPTPTPTSDVPNYADSDYATESGSITSGSYLDTQDQNDVDEGITEESQSTGPPSGRCDMLSHIWTIDVDGGATGYVLYLDAHKTSTSDPDNFVFAYSKNNSTYTDMVTVTKTADDDTYQTYTFPEDVGGKVYIRVQDTDRTGGNTDVDTIYVDEMYVLSLFGGDPTPTPTPTPTETPTPTPTETPEGYIYVNDIAMSYKSAGPNISGLATVWIKDDSGADVGSATVYGDWSGATSESQSGTTGSDGKVTFESSKVRNGGTFTFCVTNVEATGYTYDETMNVETCDSITAP